MNNLCNPLRVLGAGFYACLHVTCVKNEQNTGLSLLKLW